MHRAAYHFIKALGIPSLTKTKKALKTRAAEDDDHDMEAENSEDEDIEDDEADIDVSMELEASADDPEAMAATAIVDFDPGDTLGKLLALVNQIRMSSDGVREYLAHACAMCEVKAIELLLWVRSRWGSLSHCLESTLKIQKVCSCTRLLFVIDTMNRQSTISALWQTIMRTSPL
jgi:hypothetical protein